VRSRRSAGLLLYRIREAAIEVLLVHPGGPYWKNKDEGAWSIPKGEFLPEEDPLAAARREFFEETGVAIEGELRALKPLRQPGGKIVHAWAVEADLDPPTIVSNTFEIEWPPRSGRLQSFPEIDRGAWFSLPEARRKILRGQVPLLEELARNRGGHPASI
jgi:predicted NUDIX family NTP pyrophosphohydrolase